MGIFYKIEIKYGIHGFLIFYITNSDEMIKIKDDIKGY